MAKTDELPELDPPLGIDELARRCGTTVRTIREYQTLGVLPPPRKQGRVAVYDDGHVARLRAVARLQERGYSLAAIGDLLSAWETGSSLPAVLGLEDPTVGAIDEQPVIVSAADLRAELPAVFDSSAMARRAVRAGLVGVVDDERFAVRSPALVQLVAELLEAGLPATTGLDLAEAISAHASALAQPVADVVVEYLAGPPGEHEPSPEGIRRVQRARLLLAQAAATMLVDRIGALLNERSVDDPQLAALIDAVRVGQVRDATR